MKECTIVVATKDHLPFLLNEDKHISKERMEEKIKREEILLLAVDGKGIGWLRYNLFWDEIPFMNLLFIIDGYKGMGYEKILVRYWEEMLMHKGYSRFMTSTMSNEDAQHFYGKIGYTDIGGFTLPTEPLELMLMKDTGATIEN